MFKEIVGKFKGAKLSDFYPLIFTVIFIFVIIQYSFTALDTILYDTWLQTDIFHKSSDDIVIITLDQESDRFLGESYPYTYASHYRALEKIIKEKPSFIGYLAELPTNLEELEIKNKRKLDDFLISNRDSKTKIIKGVPEDQFIINDKSLLYEQAIFPMEGSFGRKFSRDQVIRRVVLNMGGENTFFMRAANYLNNTPEKAPNAFKGAYYDRLSDSTYTHFKYNKGRFPEIPFHRVVVGYFPDDFFKDKIVIVGSDYLSKPDDYQLTPYDRTGATRMSSLQIYAHMIQSLMESRTVNSFPNDLLKILAVILSVLLSFAISRMRPTRGLLLLFYIIAAVFLLSFLLFHLGGVWLNISYVVLSVFAVYYIWVPFRAIAEYQTRYAIEKEANILKKVDHLKQNFISLMSHDLKTPVAKIAGIADILKVQYENTEHQHKSLENIIDSTKELNQFISSILDLTKIESQDLNIKKVSKDINPFIENVVEKLQFEAQKYNVTLESELDPLYPIKLDPVLIVRVLSNLVENALKYSGEGSQIVVKSWDDEQWVYVEVRDNGRGIDPDSLQNIFEKFYRVKNDSVHAIKGSGLGLYLVKYFIELHQGTIDVASVVGEGTVFTIKLINE